MSVLMVNDSVDFGTMKETWLTDGTASHITALEKGYIHVKRVCERNH